MYSEKLGHTHFWLTFIGMNLTYFPWFLISEMPRRMVTYSATETTWAQMHLLSSVGAVILLLGQIIFAINMISSSMKGPRALSNPWGGYSLEWTVSSPPPASTFMNRPIITEQGRVKYSFYPTSWAHLENDGGRIESNIDETDFKEDSG
jgi:heme/copper-type cytochrome/quinol oxidase subunit 1